MTFRFVPKFKEQVQEVSNAQKSMGRDSSEGSVFARVKNSIRILSAVITWSLENAIDTSDSMKSRGYGLTGRTAYSNYVFDKKRCNCFNLFGGYDYIFLIGALLGKINYRYFPSMRGTDMSFYSTSIFISYIMICIMPIIIEIWEELKVEKIKIKNLIFSYPNSEKTALNDINLTINQGEFVTICGKSGCGKSTLLRHLKPILTPHGKTSGEIYFDGKSIYDLSGQGASRKYRICNAKS